MMGVVTKTSVFVSHILRPRYGDPFAGNGYVIYLDEINH